MSRSGERVAALLLSPSTGLSAASGLGWALIAFFIGHRVFGYAIVGGLVASPFVGILIGRLASRLHDKPAWIQVLGSLLHLYVAAVCFALGVALSHLVLEPRMPPLGLVIVDVYAVLWGLTISGFAFLLWPLAWFNHRLVWQADAGQLSPEIPLMTPAVRRLACGIMILTVPAYLAWAFIQTLLHAGSPAQAPWWAATDLMGWSGWAVRGLLVWLAAPVLAAGARLAAGSRRVSTSTYGEMIGVAGFAVIAFPLLSFPATLIVMAAKISIVQSWATEGAVLWESYYYRNVFLMYVPWFLTGGGLMLVRQLSVLHGRRRARG